MLKWPQVYQRAHKTPDHKQQDHVAIRILGADAINFFHAPAKHEIYPAHQC